MWIGYKNMKLIWFTILYECFSLLYENLWRGKWFVFAFATKSLKLYFFSIIFKTECVLVSILMTDLKSWLIWGLICFEDRYIVYYLTLIDHQNQMLEFMTKYFNPYRLIVFTGQRLIITWGNEMVIQLCGFT